MSIDFQVIPTKQEMPALQSVLNEWKIRVPKKYQSVIDKSEIYDVKLDRVCKTSSKMKKNKFYSVKMEIPNTIDLSTYTNERVSMDEEIWVEDFGRNLDETHQQRIIKSWKQIGYDFTVTTYGGRPKYEGILIVALLPALANLVDGYITVQNGNVLTLPVGIYSIENFSNVKPLF